MLPKHLVSFATLFSFTVVGKTVSFLDFVGSGNRDVHVSYQAVLNFVNPAMNGKLLAPLPSLLYHRRMRNVVGLFDHVSFTQTVQSLVLIGDQTQYRLVFLPDVSDMPQPVVDQTKVVILRGGFDASAAVMTPKFECED